MQKGTALSFLVAVGLAGFVSAGVAKGQTAHRPEGDEGEPLPDELSSAAPSASAAPGARPPRVVLPTKDGMIRLPGGRFTSGTADATSEPNERPPHAVLVAPFWLDRTEVTVGAYHACVDKRMCAHPARTSSSCTYDLGDAALPVACVHWRDADAYCRALGKRLPREAEWEFGARGTFRFRYPWGGWASGCGYAATLMTDATGRSCTKTRPAKVGTHPLGTSPFGVLDMTGNVEEWVADWYTEKTAEGAEPRAGASHVLRGGGWLSAPRLSRTTSRNWGSALEAGPNVGFRCARDDDADAGR